MKTLDLLPEQKIFFFDRSQQIYFSKKLLILMHLQISMKANGEYSKVLQRKEINQRHSCSNMTTQKRHIFLKIEHIKSPFSYSFHSTVSSTQWEISFYSCHYVSMKPFFTKLWKHCRTSTLHEISTKLHMLYLTTAKFYRKGIYTYRKVRNFSVSHGNMSVSNAEDGRLL